MVGIQCAENLTPSSSVACPLNIAAFPFCSKILIARMSTPRSMPASSAKNKGEQAWCYSGVCDARNPYPPTTTPCSPRDDRLACPLHMEWEREEINHGKKHKKERRAAHLASLQSSLQGKSIWRKSISHLCHGSHHQTWFPLTSSHCPPYHFLAPATMYVEGLCITSLWCQLIMLDTQRESERGLEITAFLSLLPNLYDSHTVWWKGTADLETISFFLFTKKDRTMGNTYKRKK